MLYNFLQIGSQVLVLFLLMAVGFIAARFGFLNKELSDKLTDFVLYFVAPALIIVSFQMDFNQVMNIILARLLIHDKDKAQECVLQFGSIFSNCGFMGLPLDYALFGSDGVFFGSAYIAVFNILSWSYGIVLMNKGRKDYHLSRKKVFINPGTVGVAIALVLFLASIHLPKPLYDTLEYVGSLNTPVPMFIIGANMLGMSLKSLFSQRKIYLAVVLRLIIVPVLAIGLLYVLRVEPIIAGVCLIGASAPTAALTSMFAVKFERDTESAINMISLSTLLSIITMPFLIALMQTLLA